MIGISTNYGMFLMPTSNGCYSFPIKMLYESMFFGTGSYIQM